VTVHHALDAQVTIWRADHVHEDGWPQRYKITLHFTGFTCQPVTLPPANSEYTTSSFRHPSVLTSPCARAALCRLDPDQRMLRHRWGHLERRERRRHPGWRPSPATDRRNQGHLGGGRRVRRCMCRCCQVVHRLRPGRWSLRRRDGVRRSRRG
jgi:hypothetical protein